MRKDLDLNLHKVHLLQELKPSDHSLRPQFANFILEQGDGFSEKIIFSDEAHFYLNGCVNKKNCCIWVSEKPRVIADFFLNEAGNTVTFNVLRCQDMLANFFLAYY